MIRVGFDKKDVDENNIIKLELIMTASTKFAAPKTYQHLFHVNRQTINWHRKMKQTPIQRLTKSNEKKAELTNLCKLRDK